MNSNEKKQTILVVDDVPENLDIIKGIFQSEYTLRLTINGRLALKIARELRPDLILLDIMMPDMNGYEVCKELKLDRTTRDIPVIFLTAMTEERNEAEGLALGAVDYVAKPFSPELVKSRVKNHLELKRHRDNLEVLVEQRTRELEQSQSAAIFMLGEAGHYNDTDTGAHIWRMAAYCAAIAKLAGWGEKEVQLLEQAAPMHDTGKIGIPDAILKKPGKLDQQEWQTMRTHSALGYKILAKSDTPLFTLAAEVALSHHEKWDGSGYPRGLQGEDIPLSARIVAIADVFDALTMKRPYKEAWPLDRAFSEIERGAGNHFDPDLAGKFIAAQEEITEIKTRWDKKETHGDLSLPDILS